MRKAASLTFMFLIVAVTLAALPMISRAQDDPPDRVARLNYMQGSVSYQVSGDTDWVDADPNRPLTTGDNLWADQNSRGEVHIGSTAIRLSSETGISFLNLDDRTVQLELPQGMIEIHLRNDASGQAFEIDTPNLAFTLTSAGEYLIETDPNGSSTVIVVREGEGEVTGGGESYDLAAGQQYTFTGTDQLTYDAGAAPGFDDFEAWCQARDQEENNAVSAQYVSRDVDGYYDLDANGDWESDADYGEMWFPTGVAAGWAPYCVGHWVWITPWGWTWVDGERWGFAPFHYGRWAFVRNRWGWVPGPMVVRPVYAPALVAFVGGGRPGFGFAARFGAGFEGVAWFPLGPHDVFVPGYHASARYVQYINVTNARMLKVSDVTTVSNNRGSENFMYARNTAAVTVVSKDTFVNARSVGARTEHITAEQLEGAHSGESARLGPTHESFFTASEKISETKPAVPFSQRPVVARLNPAAPASRETPTFTNDSRPFNGSGGRSDGRSGEDENHGQPETGANGSAAVNSSGTTNSRPGFQNFTPSHPNNSVSAGSGPPSRGERSATKDSRSSSRGEGGAAVGGNGASNEERPAMKFAAPVKAREDMYDVHPPLNHTEAEAPKASSESHSESHWQLHPGSSSGGRTH